MGMGTMVASGSRFVGIGWAASIDADAVVRLVPHEHAVVDQLVYGIPHFLQHIRVALHGEPPCDPFQRVSGVRVRGAVATYLG
jgi:hypothetical protein